MKRFSWAAAFAALFVAAAVAGCGGGGDIDAGPASVKDTPAKTGESTSRDQHR